MAQKVYSLNEVEKRSEKSLKNATKVSKTFNGARKRALSEWKNGYGEAFIEGFGFSGTKDFTIPEICKKVSPTLRLKDGTFQLFRKVFDLDENGENILTALGNKQYHYALKPIKAWTPELIWELMYQSNHIADYVSYTEEVRALRVTAIKAEVKAQAAKLKLSKVTNAEKHSLLLNEANRLEKEAKKAAKAAKDANKIWAKAHSTEKAKLTKLTEAKQTEFEKAVAKGADGNKKETAKAVKLVKKGKATKKTTTKGKAKKVA